MSILIIMIPATLIAATEDIVRFCYRKANKQIVRINYKLQVRERRSRSQRRWA